MAFTKVMQDAIENVLCCVEGQVFSCEDTQQVLIIANDDTWIVRISADGSTEESNLSTEPVEELITRRPELADLPELQGFTTGFTC